MNSSKSLFVAGTLLALTATLLAGPGDKAKPKKEMKGPLCPVDRMLEGIELTDAQKEQVAQLKEKIAGKMKEAQDLRAKANLNVIAAGTRYRGVSVPRARATVSVEDGGVTGGEVRIERAGDHVHVREVTLPSFELEPFDLEAPAGVYALAVMDLGQFRHHLSHDRYRNLSRGLSADIHPHRPMDTLQCVFIQTVLTQ